MIDPPLDESSNNIDVLRVYMQHPVYVVRGLMSLCKALQAVHLL